MFEIFIYNEKGTVNLNCCPGKDISRKLGKSKDQIDSEPEQAAKEKLLEIANGNKVPSTLAAFFYHLIRRYLRDDTPANVFEDKAFKIFKNTSPEFRGIMENFLKKLDSLPTAIKDKLCLKEIDKFGDNPIGIERLAQLVIRELSKRTNLNINDYKPCPEQETPGKPRLVPEYGNVIRPEIYQINGSHVISFDSNPHKYNPEDFQRDRTFKGFDDNSQVICNIQYVPEVKAGETVTLKGYNFVDVDAKIRITSTQVSSISRELEAYVYGDLNTPETEVVNGKEYVIADIRVQDIITFKVPDDLPEGLYSIEVIIENKTGVGIPGRHISTEQFIQVLPSSAVVQITAEKVRCIKETSDKLILRTMAIPIALDYTIGEIISNHISLEGVNEEDELIPDTVIFPGLSSIGGLSIGIIGYKIDNAAHRKQIDTFVDMFIKVMYAILGDIKVTVQNLGMQLTGAQGVSEIWAFGMSAAVIVSVLIIYSIMDAADSTIQDLASFSSLDLAKLTGINFPPPSTRKYTAAAGINVEVETISKDVEYIERRTYTGRRGKNIYQIILRYVRL